MGTIIGFFDQINMIKLCMSLLLLVTTLLIIRSLIRHDRDSESKINLEDLVLGADDKMSAAKVVFLGTFGVSVWFFIWMTLAGKADTGMLMAFGSLWVTPLITKVIFNRDSPPGDK